MKNKYSFLLYISLCVVAFVFPFSSPTHPYFNFAPSLLAFCLLICLLDCLFGSGFIHKFKQCKENKTLVPLLACSGLYFLYAIGLLYSKNISFGLDDIFLKIPLLLFPLIIFSMDIGLWTKKRIGILLKLFAVGNLVALLVSVFHSWTLYLTEPIFLQFHYENASWFHHPSYASMHYCFSFAIAVYFLLHKETPLWEKIFAGIAIILFSVDIILLDSRAGILAFGFVILAFGLYIIFSKKYGLPKIALFTLCVAITLVGAYKLLPNEFNRIIKTVKVMDKESFSTAKPEQSNVRILIWDATAKVALKNLPFGVGTGDIKDELQKQYLEEGYNEPYEEHHNAHCQYLQIFATLGIIGIAVFLLIIFLPFQKGFAKRNILFLIFGIIISINFLVESMFEKQAGMMFFCFFFSFMFLIAQNQLLKDEKRQDENC